MSEVVGYHANGKRAFRSRNLRGLVDYARKHGIARAELGECVSGDGLSSVTFRNGASCKGSFADRGVMLGFFLGNRHVGEVEVERTVFNRGTAMGRIHIPFLFSLDKAGWRFGTWHATPWRDKHGTALVTFDRRW